MNKASGTELQKHVVDRLREAEQQRAIRLKADEKEIRIEREKSAAFAIERETISALAIEREKSAAFLTAEAEHADMFVLRIVTSVEAQPEAQPVVSDDAVAGTDRIV